MCDVFICSDSGVGLCEDDRKLLEGLGSTTSSSSSKGSSEKKVKFDDIESASEPNASDKSVDTRVEETEKEDGNNNKEEEEDRNRKDQDSTKDKESKKDKEDRNNRESVEKVGCAGKIFCELIFDRFQSKCAPLKFGCGGDISIR